MGTIRNILTALIAVPLFAFAADKTTCGCECHGHGEKVCVYCEEYHARRECPCECHGSHSTDVCKDCYVFHDNVDRFGVEEAVRLHGERSRYILDGTLLRWTFPPLREIPSIDRPE